MSAFERDVIIVGGGHNGLACAAYLARGGLDVLVLERRDVLGGAAATEEPWPGYRVSSASYVVSLMPPQVVRELELKRHGYEVSIITPDYFVPFPDGTSLTLWGDVARDAESIGRFSARDAEAYARFDAYFEHVAKLLKDLLFVVPPNMSLRDLPAWARTAARFRRWRGRDIAEIVRLFTMSAAIARSAESRGAEIRSGVEVARIVTSAGGRASGVELVDGTVIRSSRVVSGAHPVTTYLDLIGEERLPAEVVRDVRRYRTRSGSVKVNVALSELPAFPSWDQPGDVHRGLVAVSPSMEYLERAWDDAKYGRTSEHPYVEVVFPTAHEPTGLAPEGKHLMLAFTQYGPYELREGSWDDHREEYGARVISTLGAFAPNLEAAVEHIEILTPKDIEERFGLLGGNIMQGELTPDQMFSFRPIPGYADYRSPIAGMYLCGSGTHPGGGVMGVPGRNAASVILKDHRRGALTARLTGVRD